jgi:acyl phosphate:glycerol-3-phosphate acyltransferase
MTFWPTALLLILIAYLSGSLPFGYWAGKLKGIDIREHGSRNIGATNVVRVLGKKVGIPVFILDLLKGMVPTLLATTWMENRLGATGDTATLVGVCCAAAAVLGHMFSFWVGFKGGKGVATSAGGLLGLAPLALFIAFLVWLVVFSVSRYVALASIVSSIALPIALAVIMTLQHKWNFVLLGFGIVMGTLVVVRHRANIQRLLSGTENRFEKKKKS